MSRRLVAIGIGTLFCVLLAWVVIEISTEPLAPAADSEQGVSVPTIEPTIDGETPPSKIRPSAFVEEGNLGPVLSGVTLQGYLDGTDSPLSTVGLPVRVAAQPAQTGSDFDMHLFRPVGQDEPHFPEVASTNALVPGAYSLSLAERGSYTLWISSTGYQNSLRWIQNHLQVANRIPIRATARIRVHLVNSPGNSPITKVAACCEMPAAMSIIDGTRLADGDWELAGPFFLPIHVEVSVQGLAQVRVPVTSAELTIDLGAWEAARVRVLARRDSSVIAGARVSARSITATGSVWATGITDARGETVLVAPKDALIMTMSFFAEAPNFAPTRGLITDKSVVTQIHLRDSAALTGVLHDNHGDPLAGAILRLPSLQNDWYHCRSGSGGAFLFEFGGYTGGFGHEVGAEVDYKRYGMYVRTPEGHAGLLRPVPFEDLLNGGVRVTVHPSMLHIRLVNSNTGLPIEGARVHLVPRTGAVVFVDLASDIVKMSDAAGCVELPVLAGAEWCLAVRTAGTEQPVLVDLTRAESQTVSLAPLVPLTLLAVDAAGAPRPGLMLTVQDARGAARDESWSGTTGSDGRAQIVVPADRRLRLLELSPPVKIASAIAREFDASAEERTITVLKHVRISLEIRDIEEKPLRYAMLAFYARDASRELELAFWNPRFKEIDTSEEAVRMLVLSPESLPYWVDLPSPAPKVRVDVRLQPGWQISADCSALLAAHGAPLRLQTKLIRPQGLGWTQLTRLQKTHMLNFVTTTECDPAGIVRTGPLAPGEYEFRVLTPADTSVWSGQCNVPTQSDLGLLK